MLKKTGLLTGALSLGLVLAACGNDGNNEGNNGAADDGANNTANDTNTNNADNGEDAEGNTGETVDVDPQEWRFVVEETQGQVQYVYAQEFADLVSEKSDGALTIDVYEFGALGSEVDQVEQLTDGVVEFAIISPGFTGTLVPEGNIFALQFLFTDDQQMNQDILNESEAINEHLAPLYEEQGIMPLSFWTEGAMQWTGNSELRTPDDFDGFQMRTQESPLILESYSAYGANPTAMSWGELYTGLQQGAVDGQENPIFFIADANFNEVQDHMTISNHNMYVTMTTANPDFYNGLDDDTRGIIDEAIEEMRERGFEIQEEQNNDFLSQIEDDDENPTEIYELSEEERDAFRELALPVRDYYRENGGDQAAEILDMLEQEIEDASGEDIGAGESGNDADDTEEDADEDMEANNEAEDNE
ncbi:DctP family TRAP transporter solute-binding subunit [Alkalicoccus daliensis]|uniref:Tripartite ATP-independent transporter solute receptor, DctP family n=1 Tax=Alkalicoccus daliensis TaxID=745820 RepID=A0A1H0JGM2_9BACI|nr:DctP family TRAP transporter solute-binding subunit [Alkalicoccus daliensis]SDO42955.1 tripartite ATP-independent transporter solute receptor, DctP family [Alkalicoccus daliensis]